MPKRKRTENKTEDKTKNDDVTECESDRNIVWSDLCDPFPWKTGNVKFPVTHEKAVSIVDEAEKNGYVGCIFRKRCFDLDNSSDYIAWRNEMKGRGLYPLEWEKEDAHYHWTTLRYTNKSAIVYVLSRRPEKRGYAITYKLLDDEGEHWGKTRDCVYVKWFPRRVVKMGLLKYKSVNNGENDNSCSCSVDGFCIDESHYAYVRIMDKLRDGDIDGAKEFVANKIKYFYPQFK